ncbi:MAG TPA: hypothetical protein VLE93_00580 [Candidatus Saccharimonadales bacterium]|nr:hypothetical protein [Candidatus Saccharimonadales bacterium]
MTVISVSIPTEINKAIIDLAKKQRRSKSQIVSEAVLKYQFSSDWAEITEEGKKIAKRFGVETDDDVEKLFGRKATRRH